MNPWTIELGSEVKDRITGLTGIVVGRTEWLNGCKRITVQPQEIKDGKPVEAYTFDVEQAVRLRLRYTCDHAPSGGPMPTPSPGVWLFSMRWPRMWS